MSAIKTSLLALTAACLGVAGVAVVNELDLLPEWLRKEKETSVTPTAGGQERVRPRPTDGRPIEKGGGSSVKSGSMLVEGVPQPLATSTETPSASDEVSVPVALIPRDAFFYLEVRSIGWLNSVLEEVTGSIDPQLALMADGDVLLAQALGVVGGDPAQIDRRRTLALAAAMPAGTGQPAVTVILPVHEPTEFARSLRLPPGFAEPRLQAGYVGLTMGPSYPVSPTGGEIARDLLPGALSARLSIEPVRPFFEPALEQARTRGRMAAESMPAPGAYMAGQDFALELMRDLQELEIGLDYEQQVLEVHTTIELSEDSSLVLPGSADAVDLARLGAFVRPEDNLVALAGWDQRLIDDVLQPLFDSVSDWSMSEEDELALDKLDSFLSATSTVGEQVGVCGRFELGASRLAIVGRPPEPEALMAGAPLALAALPLAETGLELAPLETVELEGGSALHLTVDLSGEAEDTELERALEGCRLIFGSDQVTLRLAQREGWMGLFVGGDEAWMEEMLATMQGEQQPEGELAALLAHTRGARAAVVYRVDLRALVVNLVRLVSEHMGMEPSEDLERLDSLAGSEPLWLEAYGGLVGTRWSGGGRFDTGRLMALMSVLEPQ